VMVFLTSREMSLTGISPITFQIITRPVCLCTSWDTSGTAIDLANTFICCSLVGMPIKNRFIPVDDPDYEGQETPAHTSSEPVTPTEIVPDSGESSKLLQFEAFRSSLPRRRKAWLS
jgi:hypothetical protein